MARRRALVPNAAGETGFEYDMPFPGVAPPAALAPPPGEWTDPFARTGGQETPREVFGAPQTPTPAAPSPIGGGGMVPGPIDPVTGAPLPADPFAGRQYYGHSPGSPTKSAAPPPIPVSVTVPPANLPSFVPEMPPSPAPVAMGDPGPRRAPIAPPAPAAPSMLFPEGGAGQLFGSSGGLFGGGLGAPGRTPTEAAGPTALMLQLMQLLQSTGRT